MEVLYDRYGIDTGLFSELRHYPNKTMISYRYWISILDKKN